MGIFERLESVMPHGECFGRGFHPEPFNLLREFEPGRGLHLDPLNLLREFEPRGGRFPLFGALRNECESLLEFSDPFRLGEIIRESVRKAIEWTEEARELAEEGEFLHCPPMEGGMPGYGCRPPYSNFGRPQSNDHGLQPGYGSDSPDSYGPQEAAPLGPGEKAQASNLLDYFMEKGLSLAQAAGILGNMQTESGFRTDAYNPEEGAIGLCQWEGGRRAELERFAAQLGRPVTDWMTQAEFVMHELTGSESGAMSNLLSCESAQEAARVFQSQYERSAALTNRAYNAANIYRQFA